MPSGQSDCMTILTCAWAGGRAAKKFTVLDDGAIHKEDYNAGKYFQVERAPVSNLQDIKAVLECLGPQKNKLVIRGEPKSGLTGIVRRKMHGEEAAFSPTPRRWVMVDLDKVPYPSYADVIHDPEKVIRAMKDLLPQAFRATRCVYRFSSSQGVPKKVGQEPPNTVSAHLYFWCDRFLSDAEWKNIFRTNPCPVDQAIYNAVQAHYVADPVFIGMADPVPRRIGIC